MSRPNLHRGHCFTCGAEDVAERHVCPDPEVLFPQPLPKPFVKRWDPIGGMWVHCMVENGKAWCFQSATYTEVKPGEELTRPLPEVAP
mgnify:CR=1 FL=1